MDIDEVEALARILLANYIEGSASPRANSAMAKDVSLGLALRKPPSFDDNFDYSEFDGKTYDPGQGPDWASTVTYQFEASCPLRRCLVNKGQGSSRLLLRFILVSSYGVGQYPPALPGRPPSAAPPHTNTIPVRLPNAYELGVALGNECARALEVFLYEELGQSIVGWDMEFEWFNASDFEVANAPGAAFDVFEST
jgi:hypothetical protein